MADVDGRPEIVARKPPAQVAVARVTVDQVAGLGLEADLNAAALRRVEQPMQALDQALNRGLRVVAALHRAAPDRDQIGAQALRQAKAAEIEVEPATRGGLVA